MSSRRVAVATGGGLKNQAYEMLPVADLAARAAAFNPRKISKHDLDALRRSMREFGVVEPVVLNTRSGRVVGGHQRVRAAQAEGIEALPVVRVDLDDVREKQLNLALNRISGEWDDALLAKLLDEMKRDGADLAVTGFEDAEIEAVLRGLVAQGGLVDPDMVPGPPDVPTTRRGDRIVLGRHVLLCGDAGSAEDLDALLGGERVHLLNTDPPYNVKVEPRSNNAIAHGLSVGVRTGKGAVGAAQMERVRGNHQAFDAGEQSAHVFGKDGRLARGKKNQGLDLARHPDKSMPTGKMRAKDRRLDNDFLTDEAYATKLRAWFGNAARVLEPGRTFYVWGGFGTVRQYLPALEETGLRYVQVIIWVKGWPFLARSDFMHDYEGAFYGWKEGAAHYFNPEIKNATDVWAVKKIAPPSMVHLTEKPVELAERAMLYSSRAGENVLDLFGGSGSTLIAAERMGRRAFLCELDPAYCDVVVDRFEAFTGQRATRPARDGKGA